MKVASQTLDRMVYLCEFGALVGLHTDLGEPWSFIFIITTYTVLLIVMFLQESNDGTVVGSCLVC